MRRTLALHATFPGVALCLLLLSGCAGDTGPTSPIPPSPGPTVSVVEGEDYTLPTKATVAPQGGYVDHPDPGLPGRTQRNVWTTWAALEPSPGQYDWSVIENALANVSANGYVASLHIEGVTCGSGLAGVPTGDTGAVPPWAFAQFGLGENDVVNLGGQFRLLVIPAWRPEIRAAFAALIRAFGQQGFPHDARLGSAYVHGLSPTRGEEFWLDQWQIDVLEAQVGLTPALLEEWTLSNFGAYADAFGADVPKLAWVGIRGSWRFCDPAYDAVATRLYQEAWRLGMGIRSGGIEYYHLWIDEPALGQSVTADGHLVTDETIPPIATPRYFGDENEEYGDAWTFRFGPRTGEAQRYRFAMLRALQMRMRYLWTSAPAEQVNPALSAWARYELGRGVGDAPDAWAYLSETPATTYFSPAGVVRNLERWLVQRDVPGAVTVPVERVDRPFNSGAVNTGQTSLYYDFVARRTAAETGNARIAFDLDDRFTTGSAVEIKVEFRDDSLAAWRIEYQNVTGATAVTPPFRNRGDGKVKTATFTILDARFVNGLPNGVDFHVLTDGPGDVTVRWVRVVR